MNESAYLDLVSGRRRGLSAALLRGLLGIAEPLYGLGVGCRNVLYNSQVKRCQRAFAPVISVGNITTGGTGKTPTVAWIVNWLQEQGYSPGILSRGYHSLDGEANDEKRLLDQLCREVPHIQNRNRIEGASELQQSHDCNVIVLDDGFQHRQLHRDCDLVLVDALNPWGYNHLLPRGLLREPIRGLQRASGILITRSDQISPERLSAIQTRLQSIASCPIMVSQFAATGLINASGERVSVDEVNGSRTCSFAGIGNPQGFRRTLTGVGLAVTDRNFKTFPDHYHYTTRDVSDLEAWAGQLACEYLITTRKDLVKLNVDKIGRLPLWAVEIELVIAPDDLPMMESLLHTTLT